jgi:hypothetical protein
MYDRQILEEQLRLFFKTRHLNELVDFFKESDNVEICFFSVNDSAINDNVLGCCKIIKLEKREWCIMNIDLFDKTGNIYRSWRNQFIRL